jgi:UDP-glucose 4-epimerase
LKRILVTGGAGFLGSSLCERLVNDGHRVVSVDDLSRGAAANLEALDGHERFHALVADACDPDAYERAGAVLGGVDLVFHLAAVNGTKWFHERARHVIRVNVNATLVALEAAEAWGARFVLASSPEAFGESPDLPLMDRHASTFPPASSHQRFAYGASKHLDEIAVHHAVANGLDGRIVRPFNGYGPRLVGDADGQVVAMLFRAVLDHVPMAVHGDGQQTRSFTAVDDLVDGFVRAGLQDRSVSTGEPLAGMAFNLAAREEVSILDLATAINGIVGSRAVDIVLGGGYHGDSSRRVGDTTNAEHHLGWRPTTALQAGLQSMWASLSGAP